MKLSQFFVFAFLNLTIASVGMAKTYTCTSATENVKVIAVLTSETKGSLDVQSPFQKKMECDVADYTNGSEIVKAFSCAGNESDVPSLFAVSEAHSAGMLEVDDNHYDLDCVIE